MSLTFHYFELLFPFYRTFKQTSVGIKDLELAFVEKLNRIILKSSNGGRRLLSSITEMGVGIFFTWSLGRGWVWGCNSLSGRSKPNSWLEMFASDSAGDFNCAEGDFDWSDRKAKIYLRRGLQQSKS